MADAFVCDAVRTPIGRYAGGLAPVRPDDLGAVPLRALQDRNPGVDWEAATSPAWPCCWPACPPPSRAAR
jgi:acetyl-CoA acetyltransferase